LSAFAEAPYAGYNYDARSNEVPSPNGYVPSRVLYGDDLGAGSLNKPRDMFVDDQQNLYIMDTGNNRIIKLDSNFHQLLTIDRFVWQGKAIELKMASGIFVDHQGEVYIADTGNSRIVICDQNGNVKKILEKPNSELIPKNFVYAPSKVLKDSSGILYVLSDNTNMGALTFDANGKFLGFFGADKVQSTFQILNELFWRAIASKQQLAKMMKFTPVNFVNFAIDDNDFLYTVTAYSNDGSKELIRKVNPAGNNILPQKWYGDYYLAEDKSVSFNAITVDKDHFFYALDRSTGRVFQYDQEGDLLSIFGGIEDRQGEFDDPEAVANLNGSILVLDAGKANLTVFRPTPFALTVRKAVTLYEHGQYQEALQPWREILIRDGNFDLAYVGIGKANYYLGNYREAMHDFYLGNDQEWYSNAKEQYRSQLMRAYFGDILGGILALYILYYLLVKKRKLWKRLIAAGRGRKHESADV
jgi:tetratricopeptide (TPR) repeat protein